MLQVADDVVDAARQRDGRAQQDAAVGAAIDQHGLGRKPDGQRVTRFRSAGGRCGVTPMRMVWCSAHGVSLLVSKSHGIPSTAQCDFQGDFSHA